MQLRQIDWYMVFKRLPFIGVHVALVGLVWSGVSPVAVAVCVGSTLVRMFGLTGGFHRYFSHRSYKTGRVFQFILAVLGTAAAQHGPLWWAGHHRHHHRYSDTTRDIHSPYNPSFFHAHIGWLFDRQYYRTQFELVKDWCRFPELVWIDRNHRFVPIAYGVLIWLIGGVVEQWIPGTSTFQIFMWGFVVSTVFLYHVTFSINSVSHTIGTAPYQSDDSSKNNWFFGLITMGEGWHNNHHRFPKSARQGFVWWQIDLTHVILKGLATLGVVHSLISPPKSVIDEGYA